MFPVGFGLQTPNRRDESGMGDGDSGLPHQHLEDTKFGRRQRYIRSRFCGSMPDWIECDVADDEGLTCPDCPTMKASDSRTKTDAHLEFGQRPDHAIICSRIKGCQLLI